jgi:hypothetical protein
VGPSAPASGVWQFGSREVGGTEGSFVEGVEVLWVSDEFFFFLGRRGMRDGRLTVDRFGGVIEQGAFQNAVFEAFVVGRVF